MPFLDWINKNQAKQQSRDVPYHLLKHQKSFGDANYAGHNMLIHGDNLIALKALLPLYAGRVKCIFIDPPYNTQSAFEYYDDKLEHSQWLSLMYSRLVILRELLSDDGFICVHIDDKEGSYLKVILDEIFGRANYQNTFFVQVRYADKTLKEDMAYHKQIEYCHVYRKSPLGKPVRPQESAELDKFCFSVRLTGAPTKTINLGGKQVEIFAKGSYEIVKNERGSKSGLKEIWATGSILDGNSSGRFFRDYLTGRVDDDGLGVLYKVPGIGDDMYDHRFFTGPQRAGATKGKYFQGLPLNKYEQTSKEVPIPNFYDFADRFGNCRHEGGVDFRSGKKPEHYIKTILDYFSKPGDIVLDSFLGSGSTAAVAMKMKRRFIGVEIGEHAKTHCIKRLCNVIEGEKTGISGEVNWEGGSGFSFYTLGETAFDEYGQINQNISFATLAAYVWSLETGAAAANEFTKANLGTDTKGSDIFLLYNGILGDKKPQGGNVLTSAVLTSLRELQSEQRPMIVYGESCRIGPARLAAEKITFKQIPYDIKMR